MTDLIKYGDTWKKIEDNVIEFFAIMIACSDYPIGLKNYSSIDEIIQADDFEETIKDYRELAKQMINFNSKKQDEKIKSLKLENKLLLEEMKEIRDKLTTYLEIKGGV